MDRQKTEFEERFAPLLEDNASINENVFRDQFLQGLINGDKVTVENWVHLAGTHFMPVNIVDDAGKILFIVPPLLRKPQLDPEIAGKFSVIVHEIAIRAQRSKLEGARMADALYPKLKFNEVVLEEDATTWQKIFEYFNVVTSNIDNSQNDIVREEMEW